MNGVFQLDRAGRVLLADAEVVRLLGVGAEALQGRSVAELDAAGAGVGALVEPVRRVLAEGGALADLDFSRPTTTGSLLLRCDLLPLRDADGRIAGVAGLLRASASETAMRRSERHLRAVFSGTHEYFGVLALDGTLLEANRASLDFAPGLLADAIGRKFWDCAWFGFTPGLPELVRQAVAAAAAGADVRQEVTLLHPSEPPRDFDFSLIPVRDESGHVVLIVPEGRDITERKRARARERELESQLLQAQKLESVGTLAGGIAHDFNNILGAMLGNVALALDELPPGQPARERLRQIGLSGRRARKLVQQILAFSRRDDQAMSLQPLRPLVVETVAMLQATLPAGVGLDVRLDEPALHVRGNDTQIEQLLMNLCTNAWHALPAAGGCITIGLQEADPSELPVALQGRPCATIWVQDDGCGMAPEVQARIFEPFFTTKPTGQGTGLGLAAAHGIVRSHGGEIVVHSAPGRGSRFDVFLPLAEAPPVEPAAPPPAPTAFGHGEHVLYVDDDPMMVIVAEALLQRAGYRVSGYSDPAAALAAVQADPDGTAAVVTDHNMPTMSGLELAQRLLAMRPGMPVLLTSGQIDAELRLRALQLGVCQVFHKEATVELLCRLVAEALQPRQAGGSQAGGSQAGGSQAGAFG